MVQLAAEFQIFLFISGQVQCCSGLFYFNICFSLYTFLVVLGEVTRCSGLFLSKITFPCFGSLLLNTNVLYVAGKPPFAASKHNLLSLVLY